MYDRFPQLRQIPEGTPPNDGFLDGLFFLGHICIAIYVAVGLSLALLLRVFPTRLDCSPVAFFWNNDGYGRLGHHGAWLVMDDAYPYPGTGVAARIPCLHVYVVCQSRSQKLLF